MPLTTSLVTVVDKIVDLLNANKETLGLAKVFYGDQTRLPTTPVACVEPDFKASDLKGAPRRTKIDFTVYILVYYSAVDSPQDNRKAADMCAERIETLIHSKPTLDGIVIHSLVTNVASGYVQKNKQLMRSSRLTVTAQSQDMLPS